MYNFCFFITLSHFSSCIQITMWKNSLLCSKKSLYKVIHSCIIDISYTLMLTIMVKANSPIRILQKRWKVLEIIQINNLLHKIIHYLIWIKRLSFINLLLHLSNILLNNLQFVSFVSRIFHINIILLLLDFFFLFILQSFERSECFLWDIVFLINWTCCSTVLWSI